MSEARVPAVTRPPVARTGSAAMALPAVIVDAGPVAVERFLEFFAGSIANLSGPAGRQLTVPRHRELGRGLLRALIRDAGLTREAFIERLK